MMKQKKRVEKGTHQIPTVLTLLNCTSNLYPTQPTKFPFIFPPNSHQFFSYFFFFSKMEIEDSDRPSIGFPLGLALLLILLLFMCGFFTCCIHWNKLRALLGLPTDEDNPVFQQELPLKPPPPLQVITVLFLKKCAL